jgi:hypothetical protein
MQPISPDPMPPFPTEPISPDLLAWARQTLDLDDFLEQVREIERTGGHSLKSIIREIEADERRERSAGGHFARGARG